MDTKERIEKLKRNAIHDHPLTFEEGILVAVLGLRVGEGNGLIDFKDDSREILMHRERPMHAKSALQMLIRKSGRLKNVRADKKLSFASDNYFLMRRMETATNIDSAIELLTSTLTKLIKIKEQYK